MPADAELGEYLFERGLLSDEDLCRARSLFTGAPMGLFNPKNVKNGVRWSLPAHVARQFDIVPVALRAGHLVVAGQRELSPEQLETIKGFTSLAVEFQLTTQKNFAELKSLL